jgi:hypothetical protein
VATSAFKVQYCKAMTQETLRYWRILRYLFYFQHGWTPAFIASLNGHTETLALLLENKADANAAHEVLRSEHSHI